MQIWTTASVLALVAASSAIAQEEQVYTLDEIVVSTVRGTETTIEESTASISVITEDTIEERASVNTQVGDLLGKTVPGFAVPTENLTDYGQTLRGRNFLTLIDGIPQTNTLNNDYRALNSIGLSAVEKIEVIRGTTAAYGFGGAGGLVNIITKSPKDGEQSSEVSFGLRFQEENVGDSLSYNFQATTAKKTGKYDYLLSFGTEQTGSSFGASGERRPPDSYGAQGGTDDISAYNLLLKAGVDLENNQRLEFSANLYDYEQDSDYAGVVGGGSIENNTGATPSRGNLNTKTPGNTNRSFSAKYINEDILGGTLDLQVYHNDRTTTFTRTEFLGFQYPQYETESQKTGARATFNTPLSGATNLVWGLDLIRDKTVVNPIDTPVATTPDMEMTGYAPFAQLTYDAGPLSVTGGLRYEVLDVDIADFVNSSSVAITGGEVKYREPLWNLSASYAVAPSVTVFGGYAETFQLGALSRALSDSTFATVDAIDGEGQRTESYELGLRGGNGAFDYSAAIFQSESNAGETYDANLNLVLAPERIRGIELTADYAINDQWAIGGTATFLEGEYDTDGDGSRDSDLGSDRIPPTKFTAYVNFAPNSWSNYRLDALHSGGRNPDSNQFTGLQTIESYTVLDASAQLDIGPGVLRIGINNLLDEDYVPVLMQSYSVQAYGYDDYYYVKAPGRSISASYTIRF
ncbi:TonB-dependent receptor [Tritonibacter litoralis]|nr:TonB-dependent receptor [Tritonibacter litoralis]